MAADCYETGKLHITSVDLMTLSSPEWFTQILYARNVQTQAQSTVHLQRGDIRTELQLMRDVRSAW